MDTEKQRKCSDKRLQNLKPFKPGQSGNPAGKKRGTISIASHIKRKLKEIAESDKEQRKYIDILAESLIINAIKGNGTAIREVLNRVDGLVQPEKEETGPGAIAKIDELLDRITGEAESSNATQPETTDSVEPG